MELIPDTINLDDYLQEPNPGAQVIPASRFFAEVRDDFVNPPTMSGARTPWPKADSVVRLRTGEVSLWHGTNGSGKSLITSQVALHLCAQDERCCIASFEMKPRKTLYRMTRQAAGGPEPSMRFIKGFHDWTDGRLWIFNHLGQISPERVIAFIRYVADKHRMQHVFIDSLMRCVRGEDDYNGQKDFVGALCATSMDTGVHVHLVHHTKKPGDDTHKPTKYDAKGSGAISDQVDNVFGMWRNKPKERAMQADRFKDAKEREAVEGEPDAFLINDKQRHGEWEGALALWYDHRDMSYRGHSQPDRFGGPPIEIPLGDDESSEINRQLAEASEEP